MADVVLLELGISDLNAFHKVIAKSSLQ